MSKYIRTKDGEVFTVVEKIDKTRFNRSFKYLYLIKEVEKIDNSSNIIVDVNVVKEADDIAELVDEIVLIENGNERNIVYLQEAYDRIDEYHSQGNYEPRLIGRIKVGLDKKAVAEWKENKQGLYDWVLL